MTIEDERRVYYSMPECWSGCDDPFCPYTHKGGWKAEGVDGLFPSKEEAAALLPTPTETSDDR